MYTAKLPLFWLINMCLSTINIAYPNPNHHTVPLFVLYPGSRPKQILSYRYNMSVGENDVFTIGTDNTK